MSYGLRELTTSQASWVGQSTKRPDNNRELSSNEEFKKKSWKGARRQTTPAGAAAA